MIHRIRSPEPHGCGIAALAMVMGQTYREIQQWFHDHDRDIGAADGGTHVDWDVYLCEHGFAVARKFESWSNRKRESWPPDPWADIHMCQVVISENSQEAHEVVMLGDGTVMDSLSPEPRTLKDYWRVYNVAAIIPFPPRSPS